MYCILMHMWSDLHRGITHGVSHICISNFECVGFHCCKEVYQCAAGINNGVLLIRNGDWARQFFADIAQHATTEGLAEMRSIIEAELGPLQGGFFDTPIIVYLLKTQPKYLDRCIISQSSTGLAP